jgi:hypothetical protein
LHGDRFAALGFNVRNDAISAVLARGIVDDDRRAFRREPFGDSRANENLPIYTAIVVALLAARVTSPILDGLAITILVARICQSSIHLLLEQTNMVAGIRFAFYFLQAISMIAMGILVAISTRP